MASPSSITEPTRAPAKPFRRIPAADLPNIDLRAEIHTHGYALISNLLPLEPRQRLLEDTLTTLAAANWLAPGADPLDRIPNPSATCADGDPAHKLLYNRVFNLPSFHALPHTPALTAMMQRIVGPELLVFPKSAPRLIFPNFARGVIHAHQDHTAITGLTDSYTAWMPLHDCSIQHGALRILEGSHRFGLLPTVANTGFIGSETFPPGDWVTGPIHAGDVLLFHSLTVHEAAPNLSSQFRLSIDCRFQSYTEAVNPGVLVFTGAGNRSWEEVYEGWPSTDLQYYWTKLPLTLRPTPFELKQLAGTADTEAESARLLRIAERIEAQRKAHSWPSAEKH
ncbi:MAG: phytanoyl-CoA dioxygenase family protein [Acidobacteriota bacterium]